jgi:hypothetical protein
MNPHEKLKARAAEMGVPLKSLLAMAQRTDPFAVGSPWQVRDAEWFASLWRRFGFSRGVHLRRIHYQLISGKERIDKPDEKQYANTAGDFDFLITASKFARHLGLVEPDAFVDRRNPDPHLFDGYGAFEPEEPDWFIAVGLDRWALPRIQADWGTLDFSLPGVAVSGYEYTQRDQPYHLEVWIEKSTMNDVLLPICRRYAANLVTAVGYQSISGVIALLNRLSALPHGKPARIFYISDFDPAGDSMPAAVARVIEFYLDRCASGAEVKLTPLALTEAQVKEYDLPPIPTKDSDLRAESFKNRRNVSGATELDALEALHPGELRRIVEQALAQYRDPDLHQMMQEAAEEAQAEANAAWEAATEAEQAQLDAVKEEVEAVTERYRARLEAMNAELQAELDPARLRLNAVLQAVREAVDNLRIELPDRPAAEIEPPNEEQWLYDSGRDYVEQIRHYQRHKNTEDSLTARERTCEVCGAAFRNGYSNKKMCSDKCRSRADYLRRKTKMAPGTSQQEGGKANAS